MTAETVDVACTLGLTHHWHPDLTYVDEDAPPMDEWPDGMTYHWRTAERCCFCKAQRLEGLRKVWSGPWTPFEKFDPTVSFAVQVTDRGGFCAWLLRRSA